MVLTPAERKTRKKALWLQRSSGPSASLITSFLGRENDALEANVRHMDDRQLRLWSRQYAEVQKAAGALAIQIEDARNAGQDFSVDWLRRQARYGQMMDELAGFIKRYPTAFWADLEPASRAAALEGYNRAVDQGMIATGTAPTGIRGAQYNDQTWSRINERATWYADRIAHRLDSPLRSILMQMSGGYDDVRQELSNLFGSAMAQGWGPQKLARRIRETVAQQTLARARTIARTETMRAYREAKRSAWTESNVINQWVWRANMDGATCAACIAMSGQRFPVSEIQDGHPNCRCTMIPVPKTWEELGFDSGGVDLAKSILDTKIPDGAEYFKSLTFDQQRRLLGPTRHDAYLSGVPLRSMVQRKTNLQWGSMRTLKSVKDIKATPPEPTGPKPGNGPATPGDPEGHYMVRGTDNINYDKNMLGTPHKEINDHLSHIRLPDWFPTVSMSLAPAGAFSSPTVRGDYSKWASRIRGKVSLTIDELKGTLTHEFGHYMDANMVRQSHRRPIQETYTSDLAARVAGEAATYGYTKEQYIAELATQGTEVAEAMISADNMMGEWWAAVSNTKTYKRLKYYADGGYKRTGVFPGDYFPIEQDWAIYASSPWETFARSWDQFYTNRYAPGAYQVNVKTHVEGIGYWHPDEFGPVANALDAMAKREGLIVD